MENTNYKIHKCKFDLLNRVIKMKIARIPILMKSYKPEDSWKQSSQIDLIDIIMDQIGLIMH